MVSGTGLGTGDTTVIVTLRWTKVLKIPAFIYSRGNGIYYVAGTVLEALHILNHLLPTTTLWDWYYSYPQFSDG